MSLNQSYEEGDPAQPGNGYEIQDVDLREEVDQESEQPAEKKSRFKNPFKRNKKEKKPDEDLPEAHHESDQEIDDEPPKEKKEKKASKIKLKGLFKKKKAAANESSETKQTELMDEQDPHDTSRHSQASGELTPQKVDLYGDSTATSPNQTLSHDASRMDSFKRFWSRPPADPETDAQRAEVKETEKKSWARWSVFIVVLLCIGFVVGILITALAGDDAAMQVIGPVFIVLSLFALIGKIFWTLFWTPETHTVLKPVAHNINTLMYGPSGKKPEPLPKNAPYKQTYGGQTYGGQTSGHPAPLVVVYTNPAAEV